MFFMEMKQRSFLSTISLLQLWRRRQKSTTLREIPGKFSCTNHFNEIHLAASNDRIKMNYEKFVVFE
jgi:hypothetical protein